jgi:hypothetical protein
MDVNASNPAMPAASPMRQWLDNLRAGLYLAFFRRRAAFQFHVSPNHFIAIAATSIAVSGTCSFVLAGSGGLFDPQALPSELLWVPLALLAGYLVGRVMNDDGYALLVAIALGSIGIAFSVVSSAIWFAAGHGWFRVPAVLGLSGAYQLLFAWWALATLVAIRRLTVQMAARAISPTAIVAIVVLLPAYFLPAEPLWDEGLDEQEISYRPDRQQPFSEDALYAQSELLRTAEQRIMPGRAGVEHLYFVGFAPDAAQDVFMKETLAIGKLLEERFGVGGRALSLISHPAVVDKYPMATLTSLRHALKTLGGRIDREEDVVLLHLTSHGSESHELDVEFYPLQLQAIRPADLRSALDEAGIKWRIIVISACYSGGFIDALKEAHTLVVTASDAKHTSFGCGNAFDFTYFSKAYYDEALRKTWSFEHAFALARESVRRREQNEGLERSNPQMFIGTSMRGKLASLEKRLSSEAANAK